jgi:2-polyprenyl-3-methyl-5-hydroxy-6-metoxy-1,4-benzoquinol methylase
MTDTITTTNASDPVYWLNRDDAEARRLIVQGRLYYPSTRWILLRGGIRPGMKVLDVGSGSGDVAMAAREIVGRRGSVVGVDRNAEILSVARVRMHEAGYRNVTFVPGDIRPLVLGTDFDAVVGRFVLKYVGDPVSALTAAVGHVKPGGIAVFQEMSFTLDSLTTDPYVPLWGQVWSWICAAAVRAKIEPAMGHRMREVFRAAGLTGDRRGGRHRDDEPAAARRDPGQRRHGEVPEPRRRMGSQTRASTALTGGPPG